MYRKLALCLCLVLCSAVMATAQDVNKDKPSETKAVTAAKKSTAKEVKNDESSSAKEMSGMSIVGNDEAPTSLYIVPWKSSELGVEAGLDMMLNDGDVPVDRDVFERMLEFYNVSTEK